MHFKNENRPFNENKINHIHFKSEFAYYLALYPICYYYINFYSSEAPDTIGTLIFISQEILGLPCEKYINEILNSFDNNRSSEISLLQNSLSYLNTNSKKINTEFANLNQLTEGTLSTFIKNNNITNISKSQTQNSCLNSSTNEVEDKDKKKTFLGLLKNENILPFMMQNLFDRYYKDNSKFKEYISEFKNHNINVEKLKVKSTDDEKTSYFSNDSISDTSYLKFNKSIGSASNIGKEFKRVTFESKLNFKQSKISNSSSDSRYVKNDSINIDDKFNYDFYCSENLFSTLKILQNFVEKIEKLLACNEFLINENTLEVEKSRFLLKCERKIDIDEAYLKYIKFILLFKLSLNKQFDNQNSLEDNAKNLLNNDSSTLTSIDKLVSLVRLNLFSFLRLLHQQSLKKIT